MCKIMLIEHEETAAKYFLEVLSMVLQHKMGRAQKNVWWKQDSHQRWPQFTSFPVLAYSI